MREVEIGIYRALPELIGHWSGSPHDETISRWLIGKILEPQRLLGLEGPENLCIYANVCRNINNAAKAVLKQEKQSSFRLSDDCFCFWEIDKL